MSDVTSNVSSSIAALTQEFDIITHNLANASTVGYKRKCNSFARTLESHSRGTGGEEGEIGLKSGFDFTQGNMVETGRSLDCAVFGSGFFVIETPEGPLYTRNGMFRANPNGQIVDSSGRSVAGDSGPLSIPNTVSLSQVHIASDGTINAGGVAIGKFKVVDFPEASDKLQPAGDNCFRMSDKDIEPVPAENAVVQQGFTESSNVKIVDELVDMIMVTRLYEANMKFITSRREASSSLMSVAMG